MRKLCLLASAAIALVAAAAPKVPDLSLYFGKYPFDSVKGISFLRHPRVRSVVTANAPVGVSRWLLGESTATPIGRKGRLILSYACEPHNCGPHNWTIVLGSGALGAICHYDSEISEEAVWFIQKKAVLRTANGCPSADQPLPPLIVARLQG